ncbi:MAG TPA: transcriptional repressor [Terriglobales bacterium]|nr:transcriptional repressor [Terriglobales bacterium]
MSTEFRDICDQHGLAVTYQRQVIYETVMSLPGHPSTEAIFEKAKERIPSISLATVYKNIRTFLDSGVLQEVSFHHGLLRVETNRRPHHHLVCMRCKSITDLEADELEPVRLKRQVPQGFKVQRFAVDVIGICESCSKQEQSAK